MRIITDHKWKPFKYSHEVEHMKDYTDLYDWMDEEEKTGSCGWFVYHGRLFNLCDFMRVERDTDFKGWHRYTSDTSFSGHLIKISDDGECYQIGMYYSGA